ncbi:hypothetical protein AZ09_04090 [Acetobacter aceti 1023]|nr:hypothetical protein AZ09_04090 [Acetobacter aceti 1023]
MDLAYPCVRCNAAGPGFWHGTHAGMLGPWGVRFAGCVADVAAKARGLRVKPACRAQCRIYEAGGGAEYT